MKTKFNNAVVYEELLPYECENTSGGLVISPIVVAASAASIIGGLCIVSYYVGYQVGKMSLDK